MDWVAFVLPAEEEQPSKSFIHIPITCIKMISIGTICICTRTILTGERRNCFALVWVPKTHSQKIQVAWRVCSEWYDVISFHTKIFLMSMFLYWCLLSWKFKAAFLVLYCVEGQGRFVPVLFHWKHNMNLRILCVFFVEFWKWVVASGKAIGNWAHIIPKRKCSSQIKHCSITKLSVVVMSYIWLLFPLNHTIRPLYHQDLAICSEA